MTLLDGLNQPQQRAVSAGEGPILVLAGPGSGKTRVLTRRIAYLIGYLGIQPFHILAMTFTNKAAKEMKQRVEALIGGHTRGLTLGTFHSVCARILRREAERLPFDRNFVIFDSDDQLRMVKQALRDLNIDEKQFRPHGIHASISRVKNELVLPEDYPLRTYRDEVVRRIYEKYQALLLASNAVDFDDLLLWTAHLLGDFPEIRQKYARRFEYILVDEFQDTNMAQYTLLKHLASVHGNIFVVGDVDQSIYRWRGADYRNVRRFEEDFSEAQVILLEQNYRSKQVILDAAMAVIDRNPHRTPKKLFTERGTGEKIILHEAYDDRAEARFVVETIASQVAEGQAEPGDFAVMYRTNAQSRLLEEEFLQANLPYKLVGAQRFYGRREIKDVIAFLRLALNPRDDASLLRVINVPPRKIGAKTLAALRRLAPQVGLSSGGLLLDLGRGEHSQHLALLPGRPGLVLSSFGNLVRQWQAFVEELSPLQLMDRILEDVGYHDYINDGTDEGVSRWENVMELRRLAAEYQDRDLLVFLEDVALVSDQDTMDESANVPTLLTLHAAKGLEFPQVMIVGMEDKTLPHVRSFDDPEAMAEERRLLYVGITRARDRLYLVNALNRTFYGFTEPTLPSRFLDDIPSDLLCTPRRGGRRRKGTGLPTTLDRWQEMAGPEPSRENHFSPGDKVRHPLWGVGMVLKSDLQDGDETLDIFFESKGLKRVAASMAKLEAVD